MLQSFYARINVFSDLVALEKGIIHPTIALANREERPQSIDEALASMTPEESRKTRRKFRKMLRDTLPPSSLKNKSKKGRRSAVMMRIRTLAWDLTRLPDSYELSDNDE